MFDQRYRHRVASIGALLLLLCLFCITEFGFVYGEDAGSGHQVLDFAEIDAPIYLAVDRGTTIEDISSLLEKATQENVYKAYYYSDDYSDESIFLCDVLWDLSGVDPETNGVYTIEGLLDVPEGFVIPEDTSGFYFDDVPTAHIIISDSGRIDITNPILFKTENIRCMWSWSIPELSAAHVEHAVNDEEWKTLEETEYIDGIISCKTYVEGEDFTICMLLENELHVCLQELAGVATGATHSFRISYDGKYSDVLKITIPADWQDDPETLEIEWDGDRDMVDRTGDEQDDLEQTAPETSDEERQDGETQQAGNKKQPENTVAPASLQRTQHRGGNAARERAVSEPVTERVTETQTIIGGARLQDLAERNPESVAFEKQGIALYLPTEFLLGLGLQESDTFMITIRREANGFFVSVSVNGEILSEIPKSLVRIPMDGLQGSAAYGLLQQDKDIWVAAEADTEAGTLSARITELGYYEIRSDANDSEDGAEDEAADAQTTGAPKSGAFAAGLAVLAAISCPVIYILRIRQKGRKFDE